MPIAQHSCIGQPEMRLWYFGAHAGISFEKGLVSSVDWRDSVRSAPGMFQTESGREIIAVSQDSIYNLASGSASRNIRRQGGLPEAVVVRKPGSRDTLLSFATNMLIAYDGQFPSELIYGAMTASKFALNTNDSEFELRSDTDTICRVYSGDRWIADTRQASATFTITPHSNGRDLWLIIPTVYPTGVQIGLITPNGIVIEVRHVPLPFVRGWPLAAPSGDMSFITPGECKVSPSGRNVAFASGIRGRLLLFDFDNSTGSLDNPRQLADSNLIYDGNVTILQNIGAVSKPYGVEFSPDSRYLYATRMSYEGLGLHKELHVNINEITDSTAGELTQYDLSMTSENAIRSSKQVIIPLSRDNRIAGLQLGPDGRIYVAQRGHQFVSRINNPNAAGLACGFERVAVKLLDSTACGFGFPFVMASTLGPQLRAVSQDVCVGDTARIPLAGAFITDSVVWDFGDSTSPTNVGYGRTGSHFYRAPGAYFVNATMYVGSQPEKPVTAWVYVHSNPIAVASLSRDSVCPGDTLTLIGSGGTSVRWYEQGSLIAEGKRIVFRPDSTTTLSVVVESAFGCLDTTTVTVRVKPSATIVLARDTTVCLGMLVELRPIISGADSYTWSSNPVDPSLQSNGPTATFTARTNGSYTINASRVNGCIRSKTINVTVLPLPTIVARGDTTICRPSPVRLSATGARTYTWQDEAGGSVGTGASLNVTPQQTTKYVVAGVDSNGCSNMDTVVVTLRPDVDLTVAGDNISCDGQPITLVCSAPSGVNESDILWLDEAGSTFARGKSATVTPTRRTIYRATLPGAGECTDTVVHEIKVGTRPQFTVTPTDTTVCAGVTVVVVSSTGKVITVPSQPGSSRIAITEEDSVGCATTMESWIRGITPNAITASLRDTTVDIGNGTTTLHVNIIAPQQFVGTTLGSIVLRVAHKTRSIKVDKFIDARTGAILTPSTQDIVGNMSQFEITVPTTTLTSTTEPLLNIEGLPLIDDDSTSVVDVQILSIAGLGACTDSSSHGGVLTITGCGMEYVSGLRVGSPLSVTAYPNPTSDNLNVAIDVGMTGTISIDIIDALGQRISSQNIERLASSRQIDNIMFDMHNIPSGIYRVVVATPVEMRAVGVVKNN